MDTLSRREEEALWKTTKARAMKACDEEVQAFAACAQGRTVSVVWACRGPLQVMQKCIYQYTNPDNMDMLRAEYVRLRKQQGGEQEGKVTGSDEIPGKTSST
ncbi:hypothetical protein FRC02_011137 [Tulasnella sp. 418]|nr:hypothetical protein FRC02_011137 [Tulasnella sp. 418]